MQPTDGLQGTHAALCTTDHVIHAAFSRSLYTAFCCNLNLILVYWIVKKVDLLDFIHLPLFFLNETWEKLKVNKSQDLGDFSEGTEYWITCQTKSLVFKIVHCVLDQFGCLVLSKTSPCKHTSTPSDCKTFPRRFPNVSKYFQKKFVEYFGLQKSPSWVYDPFYIFLFVFQFLSLLVHGEISAVFLVLVITYKTYL